MKWLLAAWQLLRDVLATGTGLALIISQLQARDPSSTLIVAGLALVVPAATTHAYSVISGGPSGAAHGLPPSSPSAPSPSSSPPQPPPAVHGDGAG